MGLNQSKNQNSDDKWNQIATDDMSSSVPHIKTLDVQAKNLMNKLQLEPKLNESDSPDTLSNIFKGPDNETSNNQDNNNFSDTSSLFISSDMYNNLLNKSSESKQGQTGGAPKKNKTNEQKIKRINKSKINSETSESSSSVNKYLNRNEEESDNQSDDNQSDNQSDDNQSDKFSTEVSEGDLSYLSSSAHENSDNYEQSDKDTVESKSVTPQNNKVLSSSINTSDINLVSPDTD
jgi:hypothetical protein